MCSAVLSKTALTYFWSGIYTTRMSIQNSLSRAGREPTPPSSCAEELRTAWWPLLGAAFLFASLTGGNAFAADGPDLQLDIGRMSATARIDTGTFHSPVPGDELDAEVPLTGTCVLDRDERCV